MDSCSGKSSGLHTGIDGKPEALGVILSRYITLYNHEYRHVATIILRIPLLVLRELDI